MKKIVLTVISLMFVICIAFSFGGCEKKFDNSLPMKRATVSADFSARRIETVLDNDGGSVDISGIELFDKSNNKKVRGLVGGDRLEIFYSDETYEKVDHILVEKAGVLELYCSFVPGAPLNRKEVYSKDTGVAVNDNGVYWAIDKSGNFIDLVEVDDNTPLYGTYIEEETEKTGININLHYLHALYLYNPRV